MSQEQIVKERVDAVVGFLKKRYDWVSYAFLAFIVFLAVYIRTRPLPGLRDITTGGWTLGPDLDPFLFLRWAKDIVESGSLFAFDTMRYVPLGFDTRGELILLPYLIAWFHKIVNFLGFSWTIEQSAAMFPVFMFALTVIAFFFLVRKIFSKELGNLKSNIVALISALFLSILPAILPRTIAGIPEKESAGFFFMFVAFYFFISGWKTEKFRNKIIYSILAGLFTASMALIWGGYQYVVLTIAIALFIAFMLGLINKQNTLLSSIWIIITYLVMIIVLPARYPIYSMLSSTTTLIPLVVVSTIIIHHFVIKVYFNNLFSYKKLKAVPEPIITVLILFILGAILSTILFGISFIPDKISDLTKPFITPITDRLGVTVAENRQPFFNEWESNFGPHIEGIALFFWIMLAGSVLLFYKTFKFMSKKERWLITLSYAYFLIAIIFSRYSSTSVFDGTSFISLLFYLSGAVVLLSAFSYQYYKKYKLGLTEDFAKIDFGLIVLFALFFLSIVSARGSVRTIMMLVPPASIMASYILVDSYSYLKSAKINYMKTISWVVFGLLLVSSVYSSYYFYKSSVGSSKGFVPGLYTQQWQSAMSWVRDNTPLNAVFAHWWDYGYWVQSIGLRATVLDGGNQYPYWNHLMGRQALTGTNPTEALNLFYAHNVTHFLIDPTDLGKYGAFSSIGSDKDYDRYSWIPTLYLDTRQIQEKKNSTLYVYSGGSSIDDDIVYYSNGTRIFLPKNNYILAGILIEITGGSFGQPVAAFVNPKNTNLQERIPLRYLDSKNGLTDFGTGLDAGVKVLPVALQNEGQISIQDSGAVIYLSSRVINSQLAKLYLFDENEPGFRLAHSEEDPFVSLLKSNNVTESDFVMDHTNYANARGSNFAGPIKIWEINYPSGMLINQSYLETRFPDSDLNKAK